MLMASFSRSSEFTVPNDNKYLSEVFFTFNFSYLLLSLLQLAEVWCVCTITHFVLHNSVQTESVCLQLIAISQIADSGFRILVRRPEQLFEFRAIFPLWSTFALFCPSKHSVLIIIANSRLFIFLRPILCLRFICTVTASWTIQC